MHDKKLRTFVAIPVPDEFSCSLEKNFSFYKPENLQSFTVENLVLFSSTLRPEGAQHDIIFSRKI